MYSTMCSVSTAHLFDDGAVWPQDDVRHQGRRPDVGHQPAHGGGLSRVKRLRGCQVGMLHLERRPPLTWRSL